MELRQAVFALAFIALVNAVPLTNWDSPQVSKCAQKCSSRPENLFYQPGKTYTYNYESKTKLNLNGDNGAEVVVTAKADISVIEACELALKLRDVQIDGAADRFDIKTALESQPLMFAYDDGRVESVCASPDDERWAVNVKRGILSALQVSLKSLSGSQLVREKDVLGDCETNYEVLGSSGSAINIRKTKNMVSCGRRNQAIAAFFPRSYLSPQSAIQSLPIMSNDFQCDISVARRIVVRSECVDKNAFLPLTWSQAESNIETSIKLNFINEVQGLKDRRPAAISRSHLLYARAPESRQADPIKVLELLREICAKSSNEIEASMPGKFAELVYAVRNLDDDAAANVNKEVKNGNVCESPKIKDIWVDALIMDASGSSARIIAEQISKKEVSAARANYMMTMLAFANRPTRNAVKAFAPLIEDQSAPRQAMLGISAMIRNLIVEDEQAANSDAVKNVVNSLVNIARREKNSDRAIVAIKALRNIGHYSDEATQALLEIATNKNLKNQVQVTAWAALKEKAAESSVNRKALEVFANQALPEEVRIAAYKVAVEKATRESLQHIITVLKRESSKQVGSYVSSHLENLKETSSPHARAIRELLAAENIPSHKFPKDIRKYSRNFEVSHFFEAGNIGAVADLDVIYSQSFAPRMIKANITLPIAGHSINLFEAGIYQHGLESQLEAFFGPRGSFSSKNVPEMFAELVEFFDSNPQINEIRAANRYRRASRPSYRQVDETQAEASMFLNVDGKTIMYLSTNDAFSADMRDVINAISNKVARYTESLTQDRAFSFMFLDSTYHVPSANGLPLKIDLNGTAVVGYKGSMNGVWPSVAVELSTQVGFDIKNSKPGVKLIQTLSSAPGLRTNVEHKNGRPAKVTLALPKDQIKLLSYKSAVKIVDAQNNERNLKAASESRHNDCTNSFMGIAVCSKLITPKPFFNPKTPFLPLNGPWEAELTINKTDTGMRGWEFALELPNEASEMQVYRTSFNTPGSRVNREVSAEFYLTQARDSARLRLKTPKRSIEASASHKWDSQAALTRAELVLDNADKYAVEVGLDKNVRDKKAEWKPKLRIQIPNAKPIQLGGSVVLDRDRKSRLAFDLHSDQQNKQFFKGSFVKEGVVGMTNEFKLSSDLQGDLGVIAFRLFGTADKQAKSAASDMKIEYQRPNQRKHTVKLFGKLQNLSAGSLAKYNSFVEVQMTQFPQNNFHLAWNVQHKPQEHLENEITLMWRDTMRDPSRRIHILQVSRATGITSGARTAASDNLLNIEIAPLRINWEIKASGHVEKGETPKFKVEFESMDKNARSQNKATKASFDYQYISRKPLKLSIDALLHTPNRQMIYSDRLEEGPTNEFQGKTQFQWETGKKANLDYTYRVKTDSQKMHHEIDAQFKTTSMKTGTRHQALLRMTPYEFEVKSKLNHEQNQLWDFQSILSQQGKSNLILDTSAFNSKIELSPYEATKSASFELTGKRFPLSHQSTIQSTPDSMNFASKTIYNQRPILSLSAQHSDTSGIKIDTPIFEARLDSNQVSTPRTAAIEIKTKKTQGVHRTTIAVDSNKVELKSKTQYKNKPIANVDAVLSKRTKSQISLDIPQLTGAVEANLYSNNKFAKLEINGKRTNYQHKSEFASERGLFKAASITKRGAQNVATFEGQYGQKSFARLNTQHFATNIEHDRASNQAMLKVQDLEHGWEHASQFARRGAEYTVTSNTQQNGRSLVDVDGSYSRSRSSLKVNAAPAEANFEFVPSQAARFELKAKNRPFAHKTIITSEPNALVISSKTEKSGPLLYIDSRLSRRERSQLRMETPVFVGSLEANPSAKSKTFKVEVNGKRGEFKHLTAGSYEPSNRLSFVSNTEKKGEKFLEVESQWYKRGQNTILKVASADWEANLKKSPSDASVKNLGAKLSIRPRAIEHYSEITYEPRRSLEISSKTQKNSQDLLVIDSQIKDKSVLNVKSPIADAHFEVQPATRQANWQVDLKRQNIRHEGKVQSDRDSVTAYSKTLQRLRPIVLVDAKLSRKERSHATVDIADRFNGQLEANLYSRVKTAKLSAECKRSRGSHETEFSYEPAQRASLKSRGRRGGVEVWNVDAAIARADKSYLNAQLNEQGDLALEVAPQQAKWVLNAKRAALSHNAQIRWDKDALTVESRTLHKSRPLADLKTRISRSDKSNFELTMPRANGAIEVSPFTPIRNAKWNVQYENLAHEADIKYQPRRFVSINADNKRDGQSQYKVEANLVKDGKSKVAVYTRQSNAIVEAEAEAARFTLNSGRYTHKTSAQWPRRQFKLESTSDKNGRQILKLVADLNKGGKQNIKLNTEKTQAELELQPYAATKSAKLLFKNDDLYHLTESTLDARRELTLKSATRRSQRNIANIDAQLSPSRRSHITVETEARKARVEVAPYEQTKAARFTYDSHSGIQHDTEASYDRQRIALKSKTLKGAATIANVDAVLTRPRSEITVNSALFDARGHFEPKNYQTNIEVRGKELPFDHNTNFKLLDDAAQLETSTRWNGQERFKLSANAEPNSIELATVNDIFEGKLSAEPINVQAEYKRRDSRRAPRLQASASADIAKNEIRGELKWDNDENSRIAFLATAQPATRQSRIHSASLRFNVGKKTEITADTRMADDFITGPHDINLSYKKAGATPKSIRLHHSVSDGKSVKCSAKYFEDGIQKVSVEQAGRYESSRNGLELDASLNAVSEHKYLNMKSVQANLKHKHNIARGEYSSHSEVFGQVDSKKPLKAVIDTKFNTARNQGKADIAVSAETPVSERQEAKAAAAWQKSGNAKKVDFEMSGKTQDQEAQAGLKAAWDSRKMTVDSLAANWQVDLKRQNIRHEGKIQADRDSVTAFAKKLERSRPIVLVDAKLSRKERSHATVDVADRFNAKLDANLYDRVKSAKFSAQCKRMGGAYEAALTYEPRKQATFKSRGQHRGAELWNVDAAVADKAHLNAQIKEHGDLSVEVQPRQAKWALNAKRAVLHHTGEMRWDNDAVTVESKTMHKSRPIANLNTRISRADKSNFELITPRATGAFEVSPFTPIRNAKWNMQYDNFAHETDLKYQPRRFASINSDSKRDNQSIFKVVSNLVKDGKSKLALYTRDSNAIAETEGDSARFTLNSGRYTHKTDAQWPRRQFKLESNTEKSGRQILKMIADLNRDGKQNIRFNTEKSQGEFELHPFAATKTAKLLFKNDEGLFHQTDSMLDGNSDLTLKSITRRQQRDLANVDAQLSRSRRSHIAVDTDAQKARFEVNPFEQTKTARFTYESQAGKHESDASYDSLQSKIALRSRTQSPKWSRNLSEATARFSQKALQMAADSAKATSKAFAHKLEEVLNQFTRVAKATLNNRKVQKVVQAIKELIRELKHVDESSIEQLARKAMKHIPEVWSRTLKWNNRNGEILFEIRPIDVSRVNSLLDKQTDAQQWTTADKVHRKARKY